MFVWGWVLRDKSYPSLVYQTEKPCTIRNISVLLMALTARCRQYNFICSFPRHNLSTNKILNGHVCKGKFVQTLIRLYTTQLVIQNIDQNIAGYLYCANAEVFSSHSEKRFSSRSWTNTKAGSDWTTDEEETEQNTLRTIERQERILFENLKKKKEYFTDYNRDNLT